MFCHVDITEDQLNKISWMYREKRLRPKAIAKLTGLPDTWVIEHCRLIDQKRDSIKYGRQPALVVVDEEKALEQFERRSIQQQRRRHVKWEIDPHKLVRMAETMSCSEIAMQSHVSADCVRTKLRKARRMLEIDALAERVGAVA